MAVKSDKKTLELIQEVKKQKAEIAKIERPNWKTNCTFSFYDGKLNDTINLHVENDVKRLIGIAGFIWTHQSGYCSGVGILGMKDDAPTFTWGGFQASDWFDDIKLRIAKIQITKKKQKLEALEARLNSIISPELRAEMELQAIAEELA